MLKASSVLCLTRVEPLRTKGCRGRPFKDWARYIDHWTDQSIVHCLDQRPHCSFCPGFVVLSGFTKFVALILISLLWALNAQESLAQNKQVTLMNETLRFAGPHVNTSDQVSQELQFSYALSGLNWRDGPLASSSGTANPQGQTLSNASLIVQKNTGFFQYLVQAGSYALSTLGSPLDAVKPLEKNSFGPIPHAYISLNPNEEWSLQVGKLLSMPGFENPFSFQNQNIQRGLLENQNNTISQGLQLNYAKDKVTLFGTWNDGFYSGQLSWLGLGGSYQFNDHHSTNVMLGWAHKPSQVSTDVTPLLQNNSQIINLVHRMQWGSWSLTPYYQLTLIPSNATTQLANPARTQGYAVILDYSLPDLTSLGLPQGSTFHIPLRLEHLKVSDYNALNAQHLVFGPNTQVSSWTLTPTLQSGMYFLRGEWSRYSVRNNSNMNANASVPVDPKKPPMRFLLEWGVLY